MSYFEDYKERQRAREKAERDYLDELRVHWAPFQGPDKLGNKVLKLGGVEGKGTSWRPIDFKPWKPDAKATKTQTEHVDLSQRTFTSVEGFRFTFWALAPVQRGWRSKWSNNMHCEFVWMILEGTNGRGVHIGLVDPDTSEVRMWRNGADHFVHGEEIAATA